MQIMNEPRLKKLRSHSLEHQGCSELTLAQCPRASLPVPPQHAQSPVLFTCDNKRPSSGARGMDSFSGSKEGFDDTMSLMEIKDTDKTALLDSPISPLGLFGSAVDGFAECFTTAQKLSQAMLHFLPKQASSSAASSCSKLSLTQQHTKPALVPTQPQPKVEPKVKQSFRPAKRYQFPKQQGPHPKLVLNTEQPKQP